MLLKPIRQSSCEIRHFDSRFPSSLQLFHSRYQSHDNSTTVSCVLSSSFGTFSIMNLTKPACSRSHLTASRFSSLEAPLTSLHFRKRRPSLRQASCICNILCLAAFPIFVRCQSVVAKSPEEVLDFRWIVYLPKFLPKVITSPTTSCHPSSIPLLLPILCYLMYFIYADLIEKQPLLS